MNDPWTRIFSQVSKIQIKSITDSLFKYSLLLVILTIISCVLKTYEWLTISLACASLIMILVGLTIFIILSFKNPDYLRSESFHLKKKSIEILGDKTNKFNPNISDIKYISNPEIKQLNDSQDDFGTKAT